MKMKKSMRTEAVIDHELIRIWKTMLESMYIGCHSEGILPGGLNVRRRAFDMHQVMVSYQLQIQSWLVEKCNGSEVSSNESG
jgi:L-serine dehydratase